jgi:hypothetical protein
MKKSTSLAVKIYAVRGIFTLAVLAPLLMVAFALDYIVYWGILVIVFALAFPITLVYILLTVILWELETKYKTVKELEE